MTKQLDNMSVTEIEAYLSARKEPTELMALDDDKLLGYSAGLGPYENHRSGKVWHIDGVRISTIRGRWKVGDHSNDNWSQALTLNGALIGRGKQIAKEIGILQRRLDDVNAIRNHCRQEVAKLDGQ